MEASLKFKVSEIFTRYNSSKEDAHFISDVLGEIDEHQNQKFEANKDFLLSQKDKPEMIEKMADIENRLTDKISSVNTSVNKTIYIVGLVQFLAIIASVLAIMNFMLKTR